MIGAPLLTAISGRFTRKRLLLAMMALFTVGNLAAVVAPNYDFLLAARVLTALPHGAVFGTASVVAAGLVDHQRAARAISLMFTGLTVATIVGVPAATALGNAFTWRLTFALIAAVGLLAVAGIALLVPPLRLRDELHAFTKPQVWLTLLVGTLGFGGVFATYSYISPTLMPLAGAGSAGLIAALALFGLGMAIGNLLGGRLADRTLLPTM
ncbi:MFS transporter [Streptomyces sp. A1136]|uniref:MFS transporter n=1 Tax=Streptomyces sp. A1136 TaxID=2563102 RepID=UPI001F0F4EF2|nr:MFS transporter [Streptomyces sp. A1136]